MFCRFFFESFPQEGEGQYGHHYWYAGGINTPEDDDWYWSTSGLPVGQFNWNPVGEEPDGVGDYLCYRTDLDYYGADCLGKQRSICQIATITQFHIVWNSEQYLSMMVHDGP